jgi:DNA polymerase-3 subunit beta
MLQKEEKQMKISCNKALLTQAVQIVQKAVSNKSTLPILSGIYLSVNNDKLQLQATDYEISISCTIDVDVYEPGKTVLSGRYFQELVKRLPGENIEISTEANDNTIKITSNQAEYHLLSMPADEFPVLKPLNEGNHLAVRDNILRELIKKTVFACANDESRPIFTGGLLEVDNNGIRMVATNTHRLALKIDYLDSLITGENMKIIIPSKNLLELAKLFNSEHPLDVHVCWYKNQISFSYDNIYVTSRLIEGQFPDYNKVIPNEFQSIVLLDTDDFLDAVERVSLLAREGDYNIIKLSFRDGIVGITSNNPDVGNAYETVPAQITGAEIDIAFNAKYITDILKNINDKQFVFSLNTPLSPACIKPHDDSSYTYIITPVRTN